MTMFRLPIIDQTYPCTYTDLKGSEQIMLRNNGQQICTTIRGVNFKGSEFEALDPDEEADDTLLEQFSDFEYSTLNGGKGRSLFNFRLDFVMPLPILTHSKLVTGDLRVHMRLGDDIERDPAYEVDYLKLWLDYEDVHLEARKESGHFEIDLNDIMTQLPNSDSIQTCINCQWSDYSPYGSGMFGTMMCLRNYKTMYQKVFNKTAFLQMVYPEGKAIGFDCVQETYCCDQFEKRDRTFGYT